MAIKSFKPTTSSRRWFTGYDYRGLSKKDPEKSLTFRIARKGGRNNQGRITSRWRGGGHIRQYRIIDFKRDKIDMPAKVIALEYDPNRTAHIALLQYQDGVKRYIVAPQGLKIGDTVVSGSKAEIEAGNCLFLKDIPVGIMIHNIELYQGRGAQMIRSAGSSAQIMAKEGKYAHIKMPSGEVRLVPLNCRAVIGQICNIEHDTISLGKAGRSRWLGRNPRVRGVAMNPVDHPMGGGEGRSSGGRQPCSPWGIPSKGLKTRRKKKSNKMVLKERKRGNK